MPADILESPAETTTPDGGQLVAFSPNDEFDPSALDPATLLAQAGIVKANPPSPSPDQGQGEKKAEDGAGGEKKEEGLKVEDVLNQTQQAQPQPTPTPQPKDEPVNMRKLRERKEELERQYKELSDKLAEIEPKYKGFETEKARLESELAEKARIAEEARAAIMRGDARQRPDWQGVAGQIQEAGVAVEEILKLPAIAESGLKVDPLVVLNPAYRPVLNETIKVLQEAGHFAEAQMLAQHHIGVNQMRGQLRAIEAQAANEAKAWQENAAAAEQNVIRGVRAELSKTNPVFDPQSPEFQALKEEDRRFLNEQLSAAEEFARGLRSKANNPEALVAEGYKANLAFRLVNNANAGLQAQLVTQSKELAELRAKVGAYEKAAGGAGVGGAGGGGKSPGAAGGADVNDAAEVARLLDPRNLPGYRGTTL